MKISGTLKFNGNEYIIVFNETTTKASWYLISKVHRDDILASIKGEGTKYPVLSTTIPPKKSIDPGYILEAMERTKGSGKFRYHSGNLILQEVIDTFAFARSYHFSPTTIVENSIETSHGIKLRRFQGMDENLIYGMNMQDRYYTQLHIRHKDIELRMDNSLNYIIPFKKLHMADLVVDSKAKLNVNSLTAVDYESLREIMDLTWYEENGVFKKDYMSVTNIKELEDHIFTPLLLFIKKMRLLGLKVKLAIDCETTGLNTFHLSPNNPLKDRVVSIPIAWDTEEGYNVSRQIFIDMAYFNNVPMNYVKERLIPLVEGETGLRRLAIRKVDIVEGTLTSMSKFGTNSVNEDDGDEKDVENKFVWEDVEVVEFEREMIELTGHNSMFDCRSLYGEGIPTWWKYDTLQLAFNLNPIQVRGNNSLSGLTERIFGYRIPDIVDFMGRGNADKFRYIEDLRIATLYGCGDTDHTLMVLRYLLYITPKKMLAGYLKQDMFSLNRLPIAEYYGITTEDEAYLAKAHLVKKDLEMMEAWMYRYVGAAVYERNKMTEISTKMTSGVITPQQAMAEVEAIDLTKSTPYIFKAAGDEIREVLYKILKYPILSRTEPTKANPQGLASVDKFVFKKLNKIKLDKPKMVMVEDMMSNDPDEKDPLISAKEINAREFPLAWFLTKYKELDKEYSAYFKGRLESDMEGKIFKSFSMARIQTRRIANPVQTTKSNHKKYMIAYDKDWYVVVYDQAQVEPRIVTSISGDTEQIEKFNNPEKDYHTENAARIVGIEPHLLEKKIRSNYKEITLGLLYGLGEDKMCERTRGEPNDENMFATRKDIVKWETVNHLAHEMMNKARLGALEPVKFSEALYKGYDNAEEMELEFRKFIAPKKDGRYQELGENVAPYGMVTNLFGFYRLFDLSDMTMSKRGKVMRPAGNFPIQSLAAEIFRRINENFYRACVANGIDHLVKWHMLVHDELMFSVHKSVHPALIYKLLYESCIITINGHTTYYIGINIGDNWADGKRDENEAPVHMVKEVKDAWDRGELRDDDYWNHEYTFTNSKGKQETYRGPKGYAFQKIREYVARRLKEVVEKEAAPEITKGKPIDIKKMYNRFTNYMVRAYVTTYYHMNSYVEDTNDNDRVYQSKFETWLIETYGEGVEIIDLDGIKRRVFKSVATPQDTGFVMEFDEDNTYGVEEDWSFDDSGREGYEAKYSSDEDYESVDFSTLIDSSVTKGSSVGDFLISNNPTYKHLRKFSGRLVIEVPRSQHANKVKEYLEGNVSKTGLLVIIKSAISQSEWKYVDGVDMEALDKFIEEEIVNVPQRR